MAHYKFMLLEYNAGKDGKTAVTLRITKDRKRKYIKTGLLATIEQWNSENDRFVADKKLVPKFKKSLFRNSKNIMLSCQNWKLV